MKYLKRFYESNSNDMLGAMRDIFSDIEDMGGEGHTETYWVPKDYDSRPGSNSKISRIEFAGAIRLYWTMYSIKFIKDDFTSVINLMNELIDVKSKLSSFNGEVYMSWTAKNIEEEFDEEGDVIVRINIKFKKLDEVSTKDPQADLVNLISDFCKVNGYKIRKINYDKTVLGNVQDIVRDVKLNDIGLK